VTRGIVADLRARSELQCSERAAVHVVLQPPWPLQAFSPLQPFCPALQPPCPLQAFCPLHPCFPAVAVVDDDGDCDPALLPAQAEAPRRIPDAATATNIAFRLFMTLSFVD
jgi:hypothetical protein